MNYEKIEYSKQVECEGRNGFMKQVGIEVSTLTGETISLFPINSRGIGRAMMQIPTKDLPAFIKTLQEVAKFKKS